jgi:hypothetical protein
MVPRALSRAKMSDVGSIEPTKYLGTRGIPNQPVESSPAKSSKIKSHLAIS